MTTSMGSVPPPGPLNYTGEVVVPFINRTFNPQTTFNTFSVPTIWINTMTSNAYILVSKALGVADWVHIGGTPGELDTITTPDSTVVVPTAGNINFLNGTGMNITGSGSDITFNITGAVADLFTADSGTATPSGGNLIITGSSTGLTTTGSGHTIGLTGTLAVSHGGTTATSFNINGPVISNTTTTGALAAVTLLNQQFLVGNTSAAPTAKSFSVVSRPFTSTNPYVPTAGMVECIIECVGGGGGSGGCAATGMTDGAASGGGGGGEYARGTFSAATIAAALPITVTIGAGGLAGAAGNNAGGTGGTTSVGSAPLISSVGGGGGSGSSNIAGTTSGAFGGGAGGTGGTGGDFHCSGGPGGYGLVVNGITLGISGIGGSTFFGGGGQSVQVGTGGTPGGTFGGGASGSANGANAGTRAGAAGAPGYVIITEYVIS